MELLAWGQEASGVQAEGAWMQGNKGGYLLETAWRRAWGLCGEPVTGKEVHES